jgi:hypothetical protein
MEIIQTIDVFVHFIYLRQYPVKTTAAHWKFLRKKFFPRFDERMKSKIAAMRSLIMQNAQKNVSPIVQPLAHPNTHKELQTKLLVFFGHLFQNHIFSKKWCSSERVGLFKTALALSWR